MSIGERGDRPTIDVGMVLDERFELVRTLGGGGMGFVFEARDRVAGEPRAVKVLRLDAPDRGDSSAGERLLREARFVQRVDHRNVVRVFECGRDDRLGCVFVVQELLRGEDLRARLRREHKLDETMVIELLEPIADALVAAHAAGVVHRDIKPENIFLAERASGITPTLIDFGIAFAADPAVPTLTSTGSALGTPHYMSPEHVRGERPLDGRSDVWSLGVVMYECLTGRRPFDGPSAHAVIASVVTSTPLAVESLAPVRAPVAAIVARALERERSLRFSSATELRDALRDARDGHPPRGGSSDPVAHSEPGAAWIDALGANATAKVDRSVTIAPGSAAAAVDARASASAPARRAPAALIITAALSVAIAIAYRRALPGARLAIDGRVAGTFDAATVAPFVALADAPDVRAERASVTGDEDAAAPADVARATDEPARATRPPRARRDEAPSESNVEPSRGARELRRRFRNGAPVLPP